MRLAGRLGPETLVCAETTDGGRGEDWRNLEEVPELSNFAEPLAAEDSGVSSLLGRLELGSLGVPSPAEDSDWLSDLFEDTDLRRRWGLEQPQASAPAEELARVTELEAQVAELRKRLAELESFPKREPAEPKLAAAPEPAPESRPQPVPEPGPEPQPQKPNSDFLPARPAPGLALESPPEPAPESPPEPAPESSPEPTPEAGPEPVPEAALSQPIPQPSPEPLQAETGAGESHFSLRGAEQPAAELPIHFAGTRSFKPHRESEAEPAPPMIAAPSPEAPQPAADAQPAAEAPQPPMTLRIASPQAAPAITIAPPPVQAPIAAPVAAASSPEPLVTLGEPTQDVLARLAKPAPTPDAIPRRRSGSKKLWALFGGLVVVLGAVFFVFLRNSHDLGTMASLGSDQKPIGLEPVSGAASPAPVPATTAPAAVPAAATPAPAAPAAAPPAAATAPALTEPAAPDPAKQAIALVKGYPLDGGRGTVERWLSYEYTANPGFDNKESWDAGAVDATTYLVRYVLTPGPKSEARGQITYLFEADIQRQTVLGKNPAAHRLLAGEPAAASGSGRKAASRRARAKRRISGGRPPLAPLPSDSELRPPSGGEADPGAEPSL
ncbi:MAG: hypothetical protein KGO96_11695 [Elusimicrobia bacterium]|nr:hypothetical protein [Elusimicrobiota bacterium]MDE2426557.1 hypothetical protein [Elusimicrobiota bacterium]